MTRPFLLLTVLLLAAASGGAELGFRVVVNEGNPVTSLSREELADLFLKKVSAWREGTLVLPVDQLEETAVRENFNREILHKSNSAVRAYWQQRIFAGRDVPPPERENDGAVLDFVRRNRGAVGYVTAESPTAGVKALTVRR
jgi:ABC-type phosphate transport system substrate-binding protein